LIIAVTAAAVSPSCSAMREVDAGASASCCSFQIVLR
jgi:hypothetical protein